MSKSSGASDLVDVDADMIHETEKAYKIKDGNGNEVWIPKSMCEWDGDGKFTMKESFAMSKGLI